MKKMLKTELIIAVLWLSRRMQPSFGLKIGIIACAFMATTMFALPSSVLAQESDSRSEKGISPGSSPSPGAATLGYCSSIGGDTSFESIQNVTWSVLGDIISFEVEIFIANPTGCVSGQPCPEYDDSPEFVNGWVDWNGDEVWQANERVFDLALTGYNAINYSGTMIGFGQAQIPPDYVTNPIMRVNLGWSFDPNNPCTFSWTWGDVRDYVVQLSKYNIDRLTVVGGGNGLGIREIPDHIIWLQSFDGDCNVVDDRVDKDEYPFAAPSASTVQLTSRVAECPAGGDPPEVTYNWEIQGTTLSGTGSWTGFEGNVVINTPDKVGIYTVELSYTIEGQGKTDVSIDEPRKLFVTKRTPRWIAPPKREWYEKACEWGSGEKDEAKILKKLLEQQYMYGQGNWRYGYDFGPKEICDWEELVAKNITCDYADCYVFSDVFESMAVTLGIGGLGWIQVTGQAGAGFMTTGAPSIDPAFPGNARLLGTTSFDRYKFTSHSLRRRGSIFYDATFKGFYPNETAFILWNVNGVDNDAEGDFYTTVEGAKIYNRYVTSYDSWGTYDYVPPPMAIAKVPSAASEVNPLPQTRNMVSAVNTQDIHFTGTVGFSTVDNNGDSFFEAVVANVEVEVLTAGEYLILGFLKKNGQIVANRPAFESMLDSKANINEAPGTYSVSLTFSGEQIFQAGEDGPYDLMLFGIGDGSNTSLTVPTPAYDHTLFGELEATITNAADQGVDTDADGKFDHLKATVDLTVHTTGSYSLRGELSKDTVWVASALLTSDLTPGAQSLELLFPGRLIRRSGLDGPYTLTVSLLDSLGRSRGSTTFMTQNYMFSDFEAAFLEPDGTFDDSGIDSNGNGRFDFLRFNFGATLDSAGTFLVTGQLTNPANGEVFGFADSLVALGTGLQTLTLDFPGRLINAYETDGPYTVAIVEMLDQNGLSLDRVSLGFATQAYAYTDFEEAVSLTYLGSFLDAGIDSDSNGLYDSLVVNVEVESTRDAVIIGVADLYDTDGRRVVSGTGFVQVSADVSATLPIKFDGRYLFGNLRNTSYEIRNVFIYPTGDIAQSISINTLGSTGPYDYLDFEPAAVITGVVYRSEISFATGAQVASEETIDFVDVNGHYRMIYLEDGTKNLLVMDPDNPSDEWLVYINGQFVGQQNSAMVDVQTGVIDKVVFLKMVPPSVTRYVAKTGSDQGNVAKTGSDQGNVAKTGSDQGNDCTDPLTPCATIAHAVSKAFEGDTIDVAPGTYNEPGLVIEKELIIQWAGVVVQ